MTLFKLYFYGSSPANGLRGSTNRANIELRGHRPCPDHSLWIFQLETEPTHRTNVVPLHEAPSIGRATGEEATWYPTNCLGSAAATRQVVKRDTTV